MSIVLLILLGFVLSQSMGVVGSSFCSMIRSNFREPWRVAEINKTFLTLIPKVEVGTSMKQFRVIGLCNVSYKTITKIVVARLKPHLDKQIDPAQRAFVPSARVKITL